MSICWYCYYNHNFGDCDCNGPDDCDGESDDVLLSNLESRTE